MIFAFFDLRPFFYLAGLPIAFGVGWLVARARRWCFFDELYLLSTFAIYTLSFVFIFAGPFVGRESVERHDMTWSIAAVPAKVPSSCRQEAEVVLKSVDDTDRAVSICSDELAAYLRRYDKPIVFATFVVTRDYWDVRSRTVVEVAGLKRSQWR